ncbi:hypothetical protein CLM72_19790 [Pseudomonas sp. MYb193]|nr:hypothetical protein CLM72_19790 [Pseudomonas sp. MYb193]
MPWKYGQCGSWLACDPDNSVIQAHRADAFAGKPAPTVDRLRPHTQRLRRITLPIEYPAPKELSTATAPLGRSS